MLLATSIAYLSLATPVGPGHSCWDWLEVLGVFLSNIAPIVLLCCALFLFFEFRATGKGRTWRWVIALAWAGTFLFYFYVFIQGHPTRTSMMAYAGRTRSCQRTHLRCRSGLFSIELKGTVFYGLFRLDHVSRAPCSTLSAWTFGHLENEEIWSGMSVRASPRHSFGASLHSAVSIDTRLILYAAPGVAIVIALGLEECCAF